jgi:hypothetical protein
VPPAETPRLGPAEATFTLKRAAEVAGVSPSTLRRHKDLLRQHGAMVTDHGWKVPMSALIASGLMRRTTPPDEPAPTPVIVSAPADHDAGERIRELEREALELRHRAELAEQRARAAEALAEERGRTLEIERRMLTAKPSAAPTAPAPEPSSTTDSETPTPQQSAPTPEPPDPKPVHRSWWRRTFG